MPKYGVLVVEGPHDVELVYRLLSPFGMERVRLESKLDPFLNPLIPRKYPPDGDLQKRPPMPLFLQSQSHAVAIRSAEGDSRLIESVERTAASIDFNSLTGVGVILDSDSKSPTNRYGAIRDGLRANNFPFPDDAGSLSTTAPRFGAFVLPDNQAQGTLEDILLECGGLVYAGLLATATTHVDAASQDQSLLGEESKDLGTPTSKRKKAIIGSIASILRPGKTVQVSIQDNRWLKDAALAIPRVQAVQDFLVNLFEMTPPPP
ncbi:MAG: DUF3226 domain-containing protein [Isosphaeraceae bacterium]